MRWSPVILAVMLLLFISSIAVRHHVLSAQKEMVVGELPFTLESALQYRLVKLLVEEGALPEVESNVEAPSGVVLRETYTLGAEYLYALGARILPEDISLTSRIRWIALGWFCLGVPLVMLWVRGLSGSWVGGGVSAAFYAIALSSVIRSTGQELSHENFALPLMLAHLACNSWQKEFKSKHVVLGVQILSAVFLAWAVVSWDLIQYYLYLWMGGSLVSVLGGRLYRDGVCFRGWFLCFVSLYIVALLNPYMLAHGMAGSPLLMVGWGIALGYPVAKFTPFSGRRTRLGVVLFCIALLGCGVFLSGMYEASYGHFAELLSAKLRFLNHKPENPEWLTFNQRIMWTPALNSATWGLTFQLFPAILLLSIMAMAGLLRDRRSSRRYETAQLIFFYVISTVTYVLFVRFHVYVAIFGVAVLGCWLAQTISSKNAGRWVVYGLLLLGGIVEGSQTVSKAYRWGRPGAYYAQLNELVEWSNRNIQSKIVLGNFGVSSSILAYGSNPIVLHPKFETEEIRTRVKEYGEALFGADEEVFRNWADRYGVEYVVYSLGEFSTVEPRRQMRYFVNRLDPPAYATARMFESAPESSDYFRLVWGNSKYRVFDMLTVREEEESVELADQAYESLCSGHFDIASELAADALGLNAKNERARSTLVHAERLIGQGVQVQVDE